MALNDQKNATQGQVTPPATPATPNRRLAGLQAEYAPIRQGYESASQRVRQLTTAEAQLRDKVNPQTIIPRGESFRPTQVISSVPGGITALNGVRRELASATAERDSFTKPLREVAGRFRTFAEDTRAQKLASSVGATLPQQPTAAAAGAPRAPAAPGQGGATAAATPAAAPAAAPVLRTLDGRTGSLAAGVGANGENVYDNSSIQRLNERTAQPAVAAASGAGAGASVAAAPAVVAPTVAVNRSLGGQAQGTVLGIPGEAERRAEIRRGEVEADIRRLGRGSPSMRRALMDQLNTESSNANATARDVINANANMAMQDQRLGAEMAQANAQREFQAGQFNAETQLRRDELANAGRQVSRTLTSADGTTRLLRNDGSLSTLTDESGQPVRAQVDGAQLTPSDIVEAYTRQQQTIAGSVPVGGDPGAAMKQLEDSPLGQAYARLFAANTAATAQQVPQAAIDHLKANPATRDQFEAKFGKGSAAQYLNP